jgi:hypothetical protein
MAITQAQIDKILGSQQLKPYNKNQSTITNTPRDIVSGTYADILKPFVSNPVAEFLGAADLQKALDSASYGRPLTTGGSLQTGGIAPEYLAVALGLTPMGKGKKAAQGFSELAASGKIVQAKNRTQEIDDLIKGKSKFAEVKLNWDDPKSYDLADKLEKQGFMSTLIDQGRDQVTLFHKSPEDIASIVNAKTPYDYGKAYGYSDADVANFYKQKYGNDAEKYFEQDKLFTPKKTKFEIAQETAQRNASLPVSQGGLGLPATNTAMDRAKAMGFDVNNPVYHGTNADFNIFNTQGKGKTSGGGAFFTDNPVVAETYVGGVGSGGNILPLVVKKDNLLDVNARGRNWADIYTNQLSAKSKGKKYSLDDLGLDKNSATTTDELAQIVPELGLKGVNIKNVKDIGPNSHIFRAKEYLLNKYGIVPDETWSNVTGNQFVESRDFMDKLYKSQKSNITALQDPSMIRSRFAAFDPARANEADILGYATPEMLGLLAAGSAGGIAYANNDKKKTTKKKTTNK